jgi:hypothetical protein
MSTPFNLQDAMTLIPSHHFSIVFEIAFLITLLYGSFFSICLAIASATIDALNSGFLISLTSTLNFLSKFFLRFSSNFVKFSQFFQRINATLAV